MFTGSICALVTPFSHDEVDFDAVRALVDWHVASGTHGLVPVGTTGESPTLTHDEHKAVVGACVEQAAGRIPVIAGTGSNNTVHAIEFTAHAKAIGADAALVVTPYYNKPCQDGLYAHFMAVADAVALPLLIYNIPGRSVVDMTPQTMGRLARHPNIIGVKDATGDLARVDQQRELCGEAFIQLSGEDATAVAFMGAGGHGAISVTANVAPAQMANVMQAALDGDLVKAQRLNAPLAPLHRALFTAPSPGPVKHVLAEMGRCGPDVRLPLVQPGDDVRANLRAAMATAGLAVAAEA